MKWNEYYKALMHVEDDTTESPHGQHFLSLMADGERILFDFIIDEDEEGEPIYHETQLSVRIDMIEVQHDSETLKITFNTEGEYAPLGFRHDTYTLTFDRNLYCAELPNEMFYDEEVPDDFFEDEDDDDFDRIVE